MKWMRPLLLGALIASLAGCAPAPAETGDSSKKPSTIDRPEPPIVTAAKQGRLDAVWELAAGPLDKSEVEWALTEALKTADGEMLVRLSVVGSEVGVDGRRVFSDFPAVKAAHNLALDDADVRSLVAEGYSRHVDVSFVNATGDGTIELDGTVYEFLPPEYDTYQEMLDYLRKAFSFSAAQQLAERYRYKMVNGRYVEVAKGVGLPWNWDGARDKLVYESADGLKRRYIFFVPGNISGFLLQSAALVLEPEGWRLDTAIEL